MGAYYNEIDPYCAAWLRNLIAAGHITAGEVDERSIVDVRPDDLVGFERCHFFAGIGVWDYALGLAGWPARREVWTGSCPCQPFSAAGKRGGTADERHLWPAFFHLIEQRGPATVLGEQVASKDGLDWLDLVHADLEGAGYDVAAIDLCAAGVGAPHIRQRLWFVANADGRDAGAEGLQRGWQHRQQPEDGGVGSGLVGNASCDWQRQSRVASSSARSQEQTGGSGFPRLVAVTAESRPQGRLAAGQRTDAQRAPAERSGEARGIGDNGGPAISPWSECDWIPCRDGKARPVEPGTFPLAHGAPARVGRLRAYGNAIVPQVAATFIEAVMQVRP